MTKKIIHLTDLHLDYGNCSKHFDKIISDIIEYKSPKDHIILITGDMIDTVTNNLFNPYKIAKAKIDKLHNFGYTVLICVGNHDLGNGKILIKPYLKTFNKVFHGNSDIQYPIRTVIEDTAFFGLNSIEGEFGILDCIGAEGKLGDKQLRNLDTMLSTETCKYRVVYLHHDPFDPKPFHQLKDSNKLQEVLRKYKIDCVLFGHSHSYKNYNGLCGINRVYNGGTSTGRNGKQPTYRIIDLTLPQNTDIDCKLSIL